MFKDMKIRFIRVSRLFCCCFSRKTFKLYDY